MIETNQALATVQQVWIEAPGVAIVHLRTNCRCDYSFQVEANGDGFEAWATSDPWCDTCETNWQELEAAALLIGMGALLV